MTDIRIPYPESEDLQLKIRVGACRLTIKPGEGGDWVSGEYDDPTGQIPTKIIEEGGTVTLTQGREIKDILKLFGGVRKFELALGTSKPFKLSLETGASDNDLDLGGLPISRLEIKHGAGRNKINFRTPNPFGIDLLELGAGAGVTEMMNLGNSGMAEMRVEGGAASYRFDFGGALKRNAKVKISTGVSNVEIRVPATTAARISVESVLGSLDLGDGFTKKEGAFWTEAALANKQPELAIETSVAVGTLKLTVTS